MPTTIEQQTPLTNDELYQHLDYDSQRLQSYNPDLPDTVFVPPEHESLHIASHNWVKRRVANAESPLVTANEQGEHELTAEGLTTDVDELEAWIDSDIAIISQAIRNPDYARKTMLDAWKATDDELPKDFIEEIEARTGNLTLEEVKTFIELQKATTVADQHQRDIHAASLDVTASLIDHWAKRQTENLYDDGKPKPDAVITIKLYETPQDGARPLYGHFISEKSRFIESFGRLNSQKIERLGHSVLNAAGVRQSILYNGGTINTPIETEVADSEVPLTPAEMAAAKEQFNRLNINTGDISTKQLEVEDRPLTLAEKHPDWPKLKLHYELSMHGSAEDFKDFPEWIKDADIWLMEGGASDVQQNVAILQQIANLDPTTQPADLIDRYIARNKVEGKTTEVVIRTLYGSHKVVGSFDLRGDDRRLGNEIVAALRTGLNYTFNTYEETRDDFAEQELRTGSMQRQRELIMVSQFEGEIERLLEANPELKAKPELRILATMGLVHTSLYHTLEQSEMGLEMSRHIPNGRFIYRYADQLHRTAMLDRAAEPTEDLKDKVFLERVISEKVLEKYGVNFNGPHKEELLGQSLATLSRQLASRLTADDAKFFFSEAKKGKLKPKTIDQVLTEKGIEPLPSNVEELRKAVTN